MSIVGWIIASWTAGCWLGAARVWSRAGSRRRVEVTPARRMERSPTSVMVQLVIPIHSGKPLRRHHHHHLHHLHHLDQNSSRPLSSPPPSIPHRPYSPGQTVQHRRTRLAGGACVPLHGGCTSHPREPQILHLAPQQPWPGGPVQPEALARCSARASSEEQYRIPSSPGGLRSAGARRSPQYPPDCTARASASSPPHLQPDHSSIDQFESLPGWPWQSRCCENPRRILDGSPSSWSRLNVLSVPIHYYRAVHPVSPYPGQRDDKIQRYQLP